MFRVSVSVGIKLLSLLPSISVWVQLTLKLISYGKVCCLICGVYTMVLSQMHRKRRREEDDDDEVQLSFLSVYIATIEVSHLIQT